jgi:hypothetical protein
MQAWGLTELQRGNVVGAMKLFERCVRLDPTMGAIMRWQPVRAAAANAQALIDARRRLQSGARRPESQQAA